MKFSTISSTALLAAIASAAPVDSSSADYTHYREDYLFPSSAIIANETLPADVALITVGDYFLLINTTITGQALAASGLNIEEVVAEADGEAPVSVNKREDGEAVANEKRGWQWTMRGYGQPILKREDSEIVSNEKRGWQWTMRGYGQPILKREDTEVVSNEKRGWQWTMRGYGQPILKREDSEDVANEKRGWQWTMRGYGQPILKREEGDVPAEYWNLLSTIESLE